MRNAFVAIALLTLGTALGGTAMAQENDTGFYVGAGIGRFDFKGDVDDFEDFDDELQGFGLDDDDNAWKIFAGYRLMKYLALEVDYIDFGRAQDRADISDTGDDKFHVDLSGVAPYVVGILPLGPVELTGKVGYLFYDVDINADFDNPDIDGKSSREDWIWGAGIGATLFQHLALKVEYEEVNVPHGADASAYWLTGAWRF